MSAGAGRLQPRFLGSRDELFVVQYMPEGEPKAHIIYLPPFGEEMNRCRAAAARQARVFAKAGYLCSLLDFQGTGESRGSLEDASIELWLQDIATLVEDGAPKELPLIIWGCRLGALLAMFACQQHKVRACVLWQPVSSGKTYINQFLRQRAAALIAQGLPGENTGAIREQIASGQIIEVAGYPLSHKLVASIDALEIKTLANLEPISVYWLENVSDTEAPMTPRVQKDVTALERAGARVSLIPFVGNPLWQLHERAECPQLIDMTPLDLAG